MHQLKLHPSSIVGEKIFVFRFYDQFLAVGRI